MKEFNLIVSGVGGQGVMTAGQILARAFIESFPNLNVFMTEVFGEAQRGGSVSAQVRLTTEESPLITAGEANLILALEPLEGLRQLHFLKKEGVIVLNHKPVFPIECLSQVFPYPKLETALKKTKIRVVSFKNDRVSCNIEAIALAFEKGLLPLKKTCLKKAIKDVGPRFCQVNLKLFEKTVRESGSN